jgi:hypothetical protein
MSETGKWWQLLMLAEQSRNSLTIIVYRKIESGQSWQPRSTGAWSVLILFIASFGHDWIWRVKIAAIPDHTAGSVRAHAFRRKARALGHAHQRSSRLRQNTDQSLGGFVRNWTKDQRTRMIKSGKIMVSLHATSNRQLAWKSDRLFEKAEMVLSWPIRNKTDARAVGGIVPRSSDDAENKYC